MMPRLTPHLPAVFGVVALVASAALGGCLKGDPWPPPDPLRSDNDTGGPDTDSLPLTWPEEDKPLPRDIFCSAPDGQRHAVIAGLPGSVPRGDVLTVESASGVRVALTVSSDGSFAGQIRAGQGERLELVASEAGQPGESEAIAFHAGIRSGYTGDIDGLVLGEEPVLGPSDDEGQVLVHGDGVLLRSGSMVVGANLNASTAAATMATCSPTCAFDLFLPGASGDELGLFLVVSGQQAGYTEAEPSVVP